MAGRTQQIGFGTWYSSSQQPGAREAAGRTQIVVAQDEMFDAAAAGDTATATASLPVSGTATGTAAATGGTLTTTASLVDGAAVGLGPLTARQYAIGGLLPLFVEESDDQREFIVGATFLTETLTGAAVDGTATGTTIADTAAIVGGVATAAAAVSGQTLSATAAVIAGTASATATGAAAGAIVTASVSALAGAASGAANQAGATVTATATLVSGVASSDVSATALGTTIEVPARLIGGGTPEVFRQYAIGGLLPLFVSETGSRDAIISATFVEETSSAAVLWASGAASAGAELLTAVASVLSGTASGVANVTASGVTVAADATLLAGMATGGAAGDAFAEGALLEAGASLIPGVATGESLVIILPGGGRRVLFEPQDAVARGALIVCRARLIAGHASTLSLFPGAAHGSAVAANDNITPVLVSLVAGEAQGQRSYADDELLMIFAEAA